MILCINSNPLECNRIAGAFVSTKSLYTKLAGKLQRNRKHAPVLRDANLPHTYHENFPYCLHIVSSLSPVCLKSVKS